MGMLGKSAGAITGESGGAGYRSQCIKKNSKNPYKQRLVKEKTIYLTIRYLLYST